MAKTTTTAKKAAPTPPATTAGKRKLEPHEVVLCPEINSAVAIEAWGKFAGTVDLIGLVDDLRERIKRVQGGDMQSAEAMLFGQAMTLETIFTSLARRAASQEYLKHTQTYLSLALKAQAQCRATLEALAEIKNPRPVAFVKQANISSGPQQVNNGMAQDSTHAEKKEVVKNGLLEASNGNGLDFGAQGQAGRADQELETVAAGHRAAHA